MDPTLRAASAARVGAVSEPVVLQWSGGKDSALALQALLADPRYAVAGLLASFSDAYDRVTMHGVRRALIEAQAEALHLSLTPIHLPPEPANGVYDARMREILGSLQDQGISTIATGDVSLEDVRQYREERLHEIGMALLTPLWGSAHEALVRRFIDDGFEAVTVCVSAQHLDASFLGQALDEAFLARLPADADPCGENGEYHSFVHDGPLFASPIAVELGEVVARNGHCYQDLIPGSVSP